MRAMATVLGLVIVVGGGYFVYNAYLSSRGLTTAPPQQQIDLVGVQGDLLTMANAERQYLATRGTYATLEQLQQEGLLTGGTERRGYTYTAVVDGATAFTITGTPTSPVNAGWPVMTIDHTLQVTRR
jgi:hypothetical protein